MNQAEFIEQYQQGNRIFNNGSKRIRYVVGFDGLFVYYKTKPGSKQTCGERSDRFAKWTKGIGEITLQNEV